MEWLNALRGKTVGLDTAPLIYFIEKNPERTAKLKPFFAAADRQEFQIVTSVVKLLEVLVHPLRHGREDVAREYRDIILRSPSLTALPLDESISEEAARLRGLYGLKTPDAIQLATAKMSGAEFFLTNDGELPSLPGISVLVVDRLQGP